jgi:hypothetical protein
MKECLTPYCRNTYVAAAPNQTYCSSQCRQRYWRSQRNHHEPTCRLCETAVEKKLKKYCNRCRTLVRLAWNRDDGSVASNIYARSCGWCSSAFVTRSERKLYCSSRCYTAGKAVVRKATQKAKDAQRVTSFYCLICGKTTKKHIPGQLACTPCKPRVDSLRGAANRLNTDVFTVYHLRTAELCDACNEPFDDSRMQGNRSRAIDHCHESGRIRGVVHQGCNAALGQAKESPERLRALADYLERTASVDLR